MSIDCIFLDKLNKDQINYIVQGEESRHLKALHADSTRILATNGKGLNATMHSVRTGKDKFELEAVEYHENYNERAENLALAICNLDKKDRLEFAVEKAVELGVNEIFIVFSRFSGKKNISPERIDAKCKAALVQCKRALLPVVSDSVSISELILLARRFQNVILADETGTRNTLIQPGGDSLFLIGPEGGFSNDEILSMKKIENLLVWNLGKTRLRAETAAISALSVYNSLTQEI